MSNWRQYCNKNTFEEVKDFWQTYCPLAVSLWVNYLYSTGIVNDNKNYRLKFLFISDYTQAFCLERELLEQDNYIAAEKLYEKAINVFESGHVLILKMLDNVLAAKSLKDDITNVSIRIINIHKDIMQKHIKELKEKKEKNEATSLLDQNQVMNKIFTGGKEDVSKICLNIYMIICIMASGYLLYYFYKSCQLK